MLLATVDNRESENHSNPSDSDNTHNSHCHNFNVFWIFCMDFQKTRTKTYLHCCWLHQTGLPAKHCCCRNQTDFLCSNLLSFARIRQTTTKVRRLVEKEDFSLLEVPTMLFEASVLSLKTTTALLVLSMIVVFLPVDHNLLAHCWAQEQHSPVGPHQWILLPYHLLL